MERYSEITQKQKREIVLLRGSGCAYKKCTFCDYHLDCSKNETENFELNKKVLDLVTGKYGDLEVINSGSVFELDTKTLNYIKEIALKRNVKIIHFESHYLYNSRIPELRQEFKHFELKMKLGLETFDYDFRENVLKKGIKESNHEVIAKNFDEANFLFGLKGQTDATMLTDIELGLKYFDRICINVMCKNSTGVEPDGNVIKLFKEKIYPLYKDNRRIDILITNTDFGVGE